jgi:dTDP-4-amino-4,6-dideoxygalactose transaminase
VVMHYGGYLVPSDPWQSLARGRDLRLIEDAAHAAGLDRPTIFSDVAVYSFFGNKNMTTAEGGMVIAPDDATLNKVKQLRSHGMTRGTMQRLSSGMLDYDVTMLGYNYRMDELRAAIGLVQLHNLKSWNQQRGRLTSIYRELLDLYCKNVFVPFSMPRPSSNHIFPVVLPADVDRTQVANHLRGRGIQTSMHYPPIHKFSWYRDRFPSVSLPNTEEFCRRELTLPLHPKMNEADVETVVRGLADALARSHAAPAAGKMRV